MLVHNFLEDSAEHHPDKTALICGETRIPYSRLNACANRLANGLISLGVRRGDRVVIWLANSIDTVVAIFGALKAGAVFVVLNPDTKPRKLAYILDNCSAGVLICAGKNELTGRQLLADLPALRRVLTVVPGEDAVPDTGGPTAGATDAAVVRMGAWLPGQSERTPQSGVIDQDLACLIYTSGSTGEPKGVVSGHNNVGFAVDSIIRYLQNVPEDIVINPLPLSFDYGLYQVLMTFRFGGTLVLENAFGFPAAILRSIEQHRVTGLPTVPTLTSMLLSTDLSRYDLSSLRYLSNTGAAFPVAHIRAVEQRLPHVRVYSMYGMTECKRTLYLPPERLADKAESVGIAIPGTEVWIEDENGRRAGAGSTGELVVRGGHVMRGYWGDPELTARVYREGPTLGERVLYSGDLFRMDGEGFFYFVARKDDVIKSRGEKVSPREVEAVICELEGVREAAVVGLPDPVLGQSIAAYVAVESDDLNEREVLKHCARRLERFMVPQSIRFRSELPRTSNGKVDKKALAESLEATTT